MKHCIFFHFGINRRLICFSIMKGFAWSFNSICHYHSLFTDLWIGETYIMEVFEDEESVGQGEILSDDFMYWTGYLFKVWSLTYPEETPAEMLAQASVDTLRQMFLGLHVMSYEQAIEELKDLHKSRQQA